MNVTIRTMQKGKLVNQIKISYDVLYSVRREIAAFLLDM